MAFSSTPRTGGGTKLYISATLPASITASAYGALSFTEVGEITSVPAFGDIWATVAHQALGRDAPDHFKSTKDIPPLDIPAAYVPGDAGQVIVKAAAASKNNYSLKVLLPDGETWYYQGLVLGAPPTVGAAGDIIGANINVQPKNNSGVIVAPT